MTAQLRTIEHFQYDIAPRFGLCIEDVFFRGADGRPRGPMDGACFDGTFAFEAGMARRVGTLGVPELTAIARRIEASSRPGLEGTLDLADPWGQRGGDCRPEGVKTAFVHRTPWGYASPGTPYWPSSDHRAVAQALRDLMGWLYQRLEYDYATMTESKIRR